VEDGSCVQTLEGPGDGIDWVAWHPKGDILLAGSEDFSMWMWLAQTGSCMQVGGWNCFCFASVDVAADAADAAACTIAADSLNMAATLAPGNRVSLCSVDDGRASVSNKLVHTKQVERCIAAGYRSFLSQYVMRIVRLVVLLWYLSVQPCDVTC
jgi:WD40 repeat protein